MAKSKKPRSAKQLANDERLRNLAKNKVATPAAPPTAPELPPAEPEEEDFVPTEVQERHEQEAAGLKEPTVDPNAEIVEDTPEAPAGPQMPITPQVDPNLVATIVAAMAAIQQQQGAAIAQATPDQKADEAAAHMGVRADQSKAVLGKNGVQGISYRYDIEKSHYPDPTKRLMAEPRLANFAMEYNYKFRWSVDGEQFEKHGMTFAEPRFTLELFRVLRDDENEPTGRMALVARAMQHEDDFIVRMAADQLGLLDQYPDTEEGFRMLRDEVRYWRLQQWLLNIFKPAKINQFRRAAKTEIIDGKAVEVYDTELLTDHDSGVAKASTLKTEAGIGGVATPQG